MLPEGQATQPRLPAFFSFLSDSFNSKLELYSKPFPSNPETQRHAPIHRNKEGD